MTLYDTPDRASIDRIKIAMELSVEAAVVAELSPFDSRGFGRVWRTPEPLARREAIAAEIWQAIKMELEKNKDSPWASARLVAAYEFAVQHSGVSTYNACWRACEKAGKFRAARLDPPVAIRERSDNGDR